jgi:hypothetical protein
MQKHGHRAARLGLILTLVLGLGVLARSQTLTQKPAAPARDPALDEADRWLQNMDWSRAVETYERVVRRDPGNAQAWFRLGVASAQAQDDRRAAEAFEKAGSLGLADSPKMAWEAALAYARLRRGDKTIEWLSTVVDGGLRSQVLTSAPEFEFIRTDPSFQALLARSTGNDAACSGAVYRGLDFWVGEWAIYDQDRVRVATNRVARTPDGCAYVETWTGVLGDGGRSLNYYEARANRWKQVWIGDTGGLAEQSGTLAEGELRLQGETVGPDGARVLNRQVLSATASGRLRQRAEASRDGGKTWLPQFEFTYVRIPK